MHDLYLIFVEIDLKFDLLFRRQMTAQSLFNLFVFFSVCLLCRAASMLSAAQVQSEGADTNGFLLQKGYRS